MKQETTTFIITLNEYYWYYNNLKEILLNYASYYEILVKDHDKIYKVNEKGELVPNE